MQNRKIIYSLLPGVTNCTRFRNSCPNKAEPIVVV